MLPFRNIGPTSIRWLETIGVRTLRDLEDLGAVEAYLRIRDAGFTTSINLLYALEGALRDLHWADLPPAVRDDLRRRAIEGSQGRSAGPPTDRRPAD